MKRIVLVLFVLFVLVAVFFLVSALENAADRVYPTSRPASRFDPHRDEGERYFSPLRK